jgi:spore coat protein U-like protein
MGTQRPPAAGQARRVRFALAAVLCMASAAARAGDCTLSTVPINFGSYDPIEAFADNDSSGAVTLDCDPTEPDEFFEELFGVWVQIELGPGSSGTYAARTMRQPPSSVLQYNLYTTAARTTVWGDGTGGTATVSGAVGGWFSGQPNPRTFGVYARLPPAQDPSAGLHTDTITVRVTF